MENSPQTLLAMAGANMEPVAVKDAVVILIDLQNEYLEGPLKIADANQAIETAAKVLDLARDAHSPVIHIAHKGRSGGLFDRDDTRGAIVSQLTPQAGESVIEKGLPNAFAGTDLKQAIDATGKKELLILGFMTHMCVSSTARAALDLGYRVTIAADACGTRDLPDGNGGYVEASILHEVSLIALSDRFAVIAKGHDW